MESRIKTLRKTLKLSQRNFGNKIGISDTQNYRNIHFPSFFIIFHSFSL